MTPPAYVLVLGALLVSGCAQHTASTRPSANDPANPSAPESLPPMTATVLGSQTPDPIAATDVPSTEQHHHAHPDAAGSAPMESHNHGDSMKGAAMPGMDMPHVHESKERSGTSNGTAPMSQPSALYVCPMHPQVTSDQPGKCPICHMALVPKAQGGTK